MIWNTMGRGVEHNFYRVMLACFDVVFKSPCLFRESADSHAPCLALSQILKHVCYVKGLSPAWLCLFMRGFVKKYLGSCQIKPSKALAIGRFRDYGTNRNFRAFVKEYLGSCRIKPLHYEIKHESLLPVCMSVLSQNPLFFHTVQLHRSRWLWPLPAIKVKTAVP